jgi:TRAP-type mannitol/chloroaromatic compound transport system substrate-binding protein
LKVATVGAVGAAAVACSTPAPVTQAQPTAAAAQPTTAAQPTAAGGAATSAPPAATEAQAPSFNWQMATSWPVALDTIFGGAQIFAERVLALTDGKFKITPRAAGEIAGVGGLQVLDAVQQGGVEMGHTASYYYVGKSNVCGFGTALPFGLLANQQNAWWYDSGGLKAMQDFYAKKFGIIQFPAGNTGAQMGGWFRKELNSLNDLKGLKMRIPALGGEVMKKLGIATQTLAAGEIFQALQTGAIDATEWVGPYDDEKLGLHKAAKYYYAPGWWEPGPSLEVQVNLAKWATLPKTYQEAVRSASYEANLGMLARYDSRNNDALGKLKAGGVELRYYSKEILTAAETEAFKLYDGYAAADADFKAIYEPWKQFRDRVYAWHKLNEYAFSTHVYSSIK